MSTDTTRRAGPRTLLLTAAALVCFAGNSLLCRLALAAGSIDAATFTVVRLGSGALVLGLLAWRRPPARTGARSWTAAAILVAYAVPFSFAYLQLGAGIGALVLFGAVQATMIGWGIARGERPRPPVWIGLLLALGGLAFLTLPGAAAPDPLATATMAVAGVGWGAYSLLGRGRTGDPVVANAANFVRTLPFAAVLLGAAALGLGLHASARGLLLAVASGAVASGIGYSFWYAALRQLSAASAAILQLLVPVLAAAGGVALLGEHLSLRLGLGGAAILGGVALAVGARLRGG